MASGAAHARADRRRDAEDDLVRRHLPLVHYAVTELSQRIPAHVPRADLVSAAMLGLAQAARSFDAARGVPFERFASTRIRGALLDELRSYDWASRSARSGARSLQRANEDLQAKLGRAPTPDEVAGELGIPREELHHLVHDSHRATVLNIESLGLGGIADALPATDEEEPEGAILARERRAYLIDAVRALPERLRTVVIGYFFEDRPMQEIADELGVSDSRVSQLRAEAVALLRDGLNAQLAPEQLAPEPRPGGRVARRKAAYYAAVAAASDVRDRLGARPPDVHEPVPAAQPA